MPTAEHPERVAQIGEGRVFYTNPRFEVEAIRQAEGKNAAIQAGLEYASVKTAAELMGLSVAAVRKALGERRIYASFDMIPAQTDKPVCFLKLADIANCWGEPDADRLATLRDNGYTLGLRGACYLILRARPHQG